MQAEVLPLPYRSKNGNAGVQSALRDGQPFGVENLPGFDRMMHFPDDDFRAGLLRGKRPSGKRPEGN